MKFLKSLYDPFINAGNWFSNYFLLAIRLFWGSMLTLAGWGKLNNLEQTSHFLQTLGIPFHEVSAHLLALTEFIGGLAIVFGLLTRLLTIPVIFAMLVALLTAHITDVKDGLHDPNVLLRAAPFTFLMAALTLFSFGPGAFSLDNLFSKMFK